MGGTRSIRNGEMVEIRQGDGRVTMINVFSVEPRDCETLVAILTEGIRRVTSKQPGFVSSTIHASLDGTRVVNYAQWESRAAYDQLFENAEMVLFMEDLKERLRFARADASAYEVRIVIGKTGADD
jgi:quinol monooxygenase YgiN